MYVLALDTATPTVVTGLAQLASSTNKPPLGVTSTSHPLVTVLDERRGQEQQRHAEALVPQLAAILAQAAMKPKDITAVVVGVGPGPFTGLRVGMVTAAAWAHAVGCRTYGVCTLDAVATATLAAHPPGSGEDDESILVATDARRKELYWALYAADGRRLTSPAVDSPAAVAEYVRTLPPAGSGTSSGAPPRPSRAVGPGAVLYGDVLGFSDPLATLPTTAGLVSRAAERILAAAPNEHLSPMYLRRPDATVPSTRKSVLV